MRFYNRIGPIFEGMGARGYRIRYKERMAPVTRIKGEGRKILVVDDDLAIRVLLDAVLKRMGFEVMVASDGRTALDLNERYDYDLILLDLMMPIVDGYEVLDQIPARNKPHVIVFTGVEENDSDALPRSKVCDSIRKPFDLELFTNTVSRCLVEGHESPEVSVPPRAAGADS